MIDFEKKSFYGVEDLAGDRPLLRQPRRCPWDREQDHHSTAQSAGGGLWRPPKAIDEGNPEHLQEELGDVLLQVVFHARMEEEQGGFDLDDVADGICKKLIYRHPHVFGDVTVSGSGEVLQNWEELKKREKHQTTAADSVDSVARSLPGLWRAEKLQSKAEKAGFEWPNVQAALDKLAEELGELQSAVADDTNIKEELGDLLFAAVKVAPVLSHRP